MDFFHKSFDANNFIIASIIVLSFWSLWGLFALRRFFSEKSPREVGYKISLTDFFLLVFLSLFSLLSSSKFAGVLSDTIANEAVLTYVGTTFMNVMFIVSAFVYLKFSEVKPQLFICKNSTVKSLLYGAYSMFKVFGLLAVIVFIWVLVLKSLGLDISEQDAVEFFKNLDKWYLKIGALFAVAVLAPIWEELFFRGFIYGAIKGRLGVLFAAFATSILFAFVHSNLYAFFPIFILSLFFILIYEKTGDIRVSIGAHSLFNFFNAIGLLIQQ